MSSCNGPKGEMVVESLETKLLPTDEFELFSDSNQSKTDISYLMNKFNSNLTIGSSSSQNAPMVTNPNVPLGDEENQVSHTLSHPPITSTGGREKVQSAGRRLLEFMIPYVIYMVIYMAICYIVFWSTEIPMDCVDQGTLATNYTKLVAILYASCVYMMADLAITIYQRCYEYSKLPECIAGTLKVLWYVRRLTSLILLVSFTIWITEIAISYGDDDFQACLNSPPFIGETIYAVIGVIYFTVYCIRMLLT